MAATKTIIKQLESKKVEAVGKTRKLYNEAIKFYFELPQDHQGLLDLATKPLLTELEKLTVRREQRVECQQRQWFYTYFPGNAE